VSFLDYRISNVIGLKIATHVELQDPQKRLVLLAFKDRNLHAFERQCHH
jgi:hypothetical protein